MGKTSLATEFAYRFGVERVFWHTFTAFDTPLRFLTVATRWLRLLNPNKRRAFERRSWDFAELLDRVTMALSGHRVLIVLDDYQKVRDYRIHEIIHRWQQSFEHAKVILLSRTRPPFNRNPTTQLLHLKGLNRTASVRLLRDAGVSVSPRALRQLERVFGGHPLSLRMYAARPHSIPNASKSVLEEISREAFRALDSQSQRVLLALAVVRRPMRLEGIRSITGLKDPNLSLGILERRAMIRAEGDMYVIHDVLREALATVVGPRIEIHRRAAALFLPSQLEDEALEALYHATQAGDWSAVGELLERKLESEREVPSGGPNMAVFLEVLEDIPVEKLEPRHRVMFYRSHALARLGTVKTSIVVRELQSARRLAESMGEPRLLSRVLLALGPVSFYVGDVDTAERVLRQNLDIVESEGSFEDTANAFFMLSTVYERRGNHRRAKDCWRLAHRAALRAGNERMALEFRSYPEAFPSNWRKMLPSLRTWRAMFGRWGMLQEVPGMDSQIGEIIGRMERYRAHHNKADLKEAIQRLRRAITAYEARGYDWEAGFSRTWLALSLLLAKEYEDAEATASAVVEADQRTGATHCSILAHQVMSRVCAVRGQMDTARKHAMHAVRLAHRMHCGCTGIASLELSLLGEAAGGTIASPSSLAQSIAETMRKGYPDEVRYARQVAREHHIDLEPRSQVNAYVFARATVQPGTGRQS